MTDRPDVRGAAREVAIGLAMVLAIMAVTSIVQQPIDANQGRGYDGVIYHRVAEQLLNGERPSETMRFARRIGTPFLAQLADPRDLINGFLVVNAWATIASAVLLLIWFRMHLRSMWLRLALLAVFAAHWLQLVRFTFFYPVLVDAWTQVWCLAGLIGITWYERKPGWPPLLVVAAVSLAGVFFREVVLLVPLAFLFATNPGIHHRLEFPYARLTGVPRWRQWLPLAAAVAGLVWVGRFVVPADPEFSASEHFTNRTFYRSLVSYSLGWMVAFGPALFVVLFDWRTAAGFFSRHRALLVYMLGVAALGWAASLESERHALNWGAPVVLVLLGLTIERHPAWFRSGALVAFLVAAQALVSRVFLATPQPAAEGQELSPLMLLTPMGDGAAYLQLFPDYLPADLAVLLLGEYVLLGVIVLVWMGRRAWVTGSSAGRGSGDSRGNGIYTDT